MGTQASPIGLRVCQCPAVYTLADVAEKLLLAETATPDVPSHVTGGEGYDAFNRNPQDDDS
jgi:hypothetical protein